MACFGYSDCETFDSDTWLLGVDWDERVSFEIEERWKKYRESLPSLQKIHIPRWVKIETPCTSVQMHGFCDASLKAYAAAVYLRVEDRNGKVHVSLLSAKTKVAPIKTLSLPKLELCGAWLLSKLIAQVKRDMQLDNIRIYSWTDSTIVLSWLRKHPSIWDTFIANRVSQIHQLLNHNTWRHVASEENPADCASRGIALNELKNHHLWWTGPEWLKSPTHEWPKIKKTRDALLGLRKNVQNFHTVETEEPWSLLNKYSSLSKLVRVTTYCRRWIHILKKDQQVRLPNYLTSTELQQSLMLWIKRVQSNEFSEELVSLKSKRNINKNSKLIRLNPFIDDDEIIRLGGRLQYARLSFAERHPIILPEKNPLTRLIIDSVHKATMHGGTQLMLSIIRRKYWIVNARNLVRHHIHKCISCFRQKATGRHQLMANLPSYRIQPARPFAHTGVDYCGPFGLKASHIRSSRTYKGYLSIFICMVTKAIHIEVVSDLTTNGFLAAFRRFTARRGLCTDIYSDCGSNFIGANAILTRHKMAADQHLENEIAEAIENQGIKWHFIPPSSPHFGGLWEAGVRSTKFHLKRIIGETFLTYEELSTLTTQIEATLNSRPLSAISQDPQDISALTPGHLLIGGPLITPPEPSLLDMKINRLERHQYIQQLHQHFWARWSTEYLSRLQQRPKWLTSQPNVKMNDLVLIKDERLPPTRWLLGRIIQLHPGKDKLIRVVTIKTQTNTIKRPITKICSLPIQDNNIIPNI